MRLVQLVMCQAKLIKKLQEKLIEKKYENIRLREEVDTLHNELIERTINKGSIQDLADMLNKIN